MTLAEAMVVRKVRPCDLNRQSGVSRPTIDGILGKRKSYNKEGVMTGTLIRIADVLNADIAIDKSKPYYFDFTLKEGKR